jgi:hypothetical protein
LVKIGDTMTLVVTVEGDPGFDIQVRWTYFVEQIRICSDLDMALAFEACSEVFTNLRHCIFFWLIGTGKGPEGQRAMPLLLTSPCLDSVKP